jgi:Zn-dependent protease/CBS domain-containing protein
MFGGGWRVGRIGGVAIRIDGSLLVAAVLVGGGAWSRFASPDVFPELSSAGAVGLALVTTVLFFGSILGHELAHAVMFKARGIQVEGITLMMFGGVTQAREETRSPLDEFLVSVVGPLTTLVIAGAFYLLYRAGLDAGGPIRSMLWYLWTVNLIIGVFNLLPGYPLDGGRVLHSLIWKVTRNPTLATSIAARVGQVFGGALIAVGFGLGLRTGDFNALWLGIIGVMLYQGAGAALTANRQNRLVQSATAGDVMAPPPPVIPSSLSTGDAVRVYLLGHQGEAFPVVDGGNAVVGFASLSTTAGADPERPITEAMSPATSVVTTDPAEPLDAVIRRLSEGTATAALVMDGGRLVGVIEVDDVNRYLRHARARR